MHQAEEAPFQRRVVRLPDGRELVFYDRPASSAAEAPAREAPTPPTGTAGRKG